MLAQNTKKWLEKQLLSEKYEEGFVDSMKNIPTIRIHGWPGEMCSLEDNNIFLRAHFLKNLGPHCNADFAKVRLSKQKHRCA